MFYMINCYGIVIAILKHELSNLMSQNRPLIRIIGFSILGLLFVALAFVFYAPHILVGIFGLLFPIGIFLLLLIAFYLLIMSTKS